MSHSTLDFMAMDCLTPNPILARHLRNVCSWLQRGQVCKTLGLDLCKPINTSGKRPEHSMMREQYFHM